MSIISDTREILNDGKNWYQGDMTDGKGNYCILGALGCTSEQVHIDEYIDVIKAARTKIAGAIENLFPDRIDRSAAQIIATSGVIASFNDSEETVWEDVSLVLKHAEETDYPI